MSIFSIFIILTCNFVQGSYLNINCYIILILLYNLDRRFFLKCMFHNYHRIYYIFSLCYLLSIQVSINFCIFYPNQGHMKACIFHSHFYWYRICINLNIIYNVFILLWLLKNTKILNNFHDILLFHIWNSYYFYIISIHISLSILHNL